MFTRIKALLDNNGVLFLVLMALTIGLIILGERAVEKHRGIRHYDRLYSDVEFEIVGVNQPKHYQLDLLAPDGQRFDHMYISKHCNTWRQCPVGTKVTASIVRLTVHRQGEEPDYSRSRIWVTIEGVNGIGRKCCNR